MNLLLAAAWGYLCGSVPFGLVLTRLFGLGDIRQIGSGNIGATNVLRTGRKGVAALTLLLDAAKGTLTLVEDEARHIASVIAAICAVVDPEKVILSGGVGGNDQLISRAEKLIAATTAFPPPVIRSHLSDRASLVGAIWLGTRVARKQILGASVVLKGPVLIL